MARKPDVVPIKLSEAVEFRDHEFDAKKLFDSEEMRILTFAFKPGQEMETVKVDPAVLLFAYSGEGFFTVGKKEFPVEPGAFVVVPPKEPHSARAGKHGPFVALVVIAPSPTSLIE